MQMARQQLTLGIGLGVLAALLVSHDGGVHAASPARPTAAAHCQTAQLAIAPNYSEGATGHASLIFLVHNHGGQTCTLYGYPGAQLLDGAYRGLPTHLHWSGGAMSGRRLVSLASGADAYFALNWVRIPTPDQSCPVASFVRITPPNEYGSTIVWAGQGGITACGGALSASPVEPAQFSFGVVPTP